MALRDLWGRARGQRCVWGSLPGRQKGDFVQLAMGTMQGFVRWRELSQPWGPRPGASLGQVSREEVLEVPEGWGVVTAAPHAGLGAWVGKVEQGGSGGLSAWWVSSKAISVFLV